MPAKILVESFYSHTIQSTLSTTDTSVIVDIAPANDVDYAVLEIGEANQEMIKWVSRVGTTLSGLLRGLSLTATTDTEVAGNKKTHSINDTIEITDVHYLINDKVSNAATETIVGQKTFSSAVIQSVAAAGATELIRYGEAVKNTGDETIAGIKTFSSIPLLPNSSPTTDNQAARKKYIDDAIAALGLSTIIASHAVYTPAYLTGDTGAQTTIALWDSVANGSFRGTFDGVARNVDGIDFTTTGPLGIVTTMANVASVIQHYLRIATGSTETVVWSTDHFVITSVNTTSASQVSVLTTSTGTVGTDISGAGASDWMDCDTGNGVATAAVLDPTQDFGKLISLDANGLIAEEFMPTTLAEAITFFGATAITGAEAETLSNRLNAAGLHFHGVDTGVVLTKKYKLRDMITQTFTAVTVADWGGYKTFTTPSVNNQGGGMKFLPFLQETFDSKNPRFNVNASFDAATAQDAFIGFVDVNFVATSLEDSVMTLDHFGFVIQDGLCYGSVADGATQSKTGALTVTLTNQNTFAATFNGTTVEFFINGVSVGTKAVNLPGGANFISFQATIVADASAASKTMNLDMDGTIQHDV